MSHPIGSLKYTISVVQTGKSAENYGGLDNLIENDIIR